MLLAPKSIFAVSTLSRSRPALSAQLRTMATMTMTMPASPASTAFTYSPIPTPPNADPAHFRDFGRRVEGYDPASVTPEQTKEIVDMLYKHGILLFKGLKLTPKQQYELTLAFDPEARSYGHGDNKTGKEKASILHPDLKTIPHQPQVQLIGNGKVPGQYEGLDSPQLKHPHHKTFHKTPVSDSDEAAGVTRFYRWHIDAALYNLSPPKVTSLYAVSVPKGEPQVCKYDDGTGDEVKVPLGGTAFVSGATMFDILPAPMKSLAVRTKVRYAPHPYVWMSKAHALPTGLGIENEGLELPLEDLPEWDDSKVKVYPLCWKNPVTGALHVQAHPCGAMALHIDPLPAGPNRPADALYPDGGDVTDLKEVRELLYRIQRPGIAPGLVYAQDWDEGDLVLFHNRGLLHSVVGAFKPDQLRMFHQCNLAASDEPVGPTPEDVGAYA